MLSGVIPGAELAERVGKVMLHGLQALVVCLGDDDAVAYGVVVVGGVGISSRDVAVVVTTRTLCRAPEMLYDGSDTWPAARRAWPALAHVRPAGLSSGVGADKLRGTRGGGRQCEGAPSSTSSGAATTSCGVARRSRSVRAWTRAAPARAWRQECAGVDADSSSASCRVRTTASA